MTTYAPRLLSTTKARPSARMVAPVLIQVPELSSRGQGRLRPSATRGRRRIRREIRVAASTMMFALPMSWALLCFAKIGPGPVTQAATAPVSVAVADVVDPIEDRPRITISLEPSAVTRPDEPEAPLALPSGYLVPDHGSEDSAHAGY